MGLGKAAFLFILFSESFLSVLNVIGNYSLFIACEKTCSDQDPIGYNFQQFPVLKHLTPEIMFHAPLTSAKTVVSV